MNLMSDINKKEKSFNEIIDKSGELGIDEIKFTSPDEIGKSDIKEADKIKVLFPECKTVISACLSYNLEWNKADSKTEGYIARYTSANFYKILSGKLKILANEIKNKYSPDSAGRDYFRVFVNSKINDKLSAAVSGLGAYSKNSCISINGKGQRFVLGEILLKENLEISKEKSVPALHCNSCSKCIDICPTGALEDVGLNKELCIQHLSSELTWPEEIGGKKFIKLWGTRFFGCTDCLDICPMNDLYTKNGIGEDVMTGFIGTSFDTENILKFTKRDYKNYFRNNQLSSSWIPEAALARNALASLFNLKKLGLIEDYFSSLKNLGWNDEEIMFLKKFKKTFLNA